MQLIDNLYEIITPAVESLDFELWGIECLGQGKDMLLRIYIDHEDGISVDDCADVSHQVSAVLDVEDPIPSQYTLEVSSPGIPRRLFFLAQYEHYCGDQIKVRLVVPQNGQKNFRGILREVTGNKIILLTDNGEESLLFNNIERAKVGANL